MRLNNVYFLLRHGEARSNKYGFVSSRPEKRYNPLTRKGEKQIKKIIPKLKKENIDLILSSDLLRCKQTAGIIAKALKLKINYDKNLRERDTGRLNGKSLKVWYGFFNNGGEGETSNKRPSEGESFKDINKRIKKFFRYIERKYHGKKILVISHGHPLLVLRGNLNGLSEKEIVSCKNKMKPKNGELIKIT